MAVKNKSIFMGDTLPESTTDEFIRIDNPYRPHNLESGDWFYHKDVIKQIKEKIESGEGNRVVVLHGNPGSGKTSTLKRIENSPHMLGKNYIPIYLDSRKYAGLASDDFLFSVYNDSVEKINKFGYEIPKFDIIKKRRTKGHTGFTVADAVLTIDSYLKSKVLILILDEFDTLLETIDVKIISEYIRFFKHKEKKWNNYGLILAGDKRLVNLIKSETINQFLGMAANIDIEEILEEEIIKKLITEPVKDQLTYDDRAMDRIIWYSGKNLYFQQLICYYLVDHLNKEKRNQCLIRDVDEAIQHITEDTIPEFVFGWENKLSIEGRLILSALSDESVTEQKKDFYLFKENSLLHGIFGERIYDEIEKLHDFGQLHKMRKRRFSEFPLRIPVCGKWIQKEHPFIKTIFQNLEAIADKVDLNTLVKEIEKTPPFKLAPFDKEAILKIARKWCLLTTSIVKNRSIGEEEQIKDFFENFCQLLSLKIKGKPESNANCFTIEIESLKIGILEEAICFIQNRPELTEDDIFNIETSAAEFARKAQTKLTLFIYFQRSEKVEELVKKPYLNLIAIEENDFKKIIFSDRPAGIFRRILLSKLSLQKVSPYKTAGPAEATFYGRSGLINRISRNTGSSYAIVGARKIGKTSLLHKIKDYPPPGITYIYINLEAEFSDLESEKNERVFLKRLQSKIESTINKRVDLKKFPFGMDPSKLPQIIEEISREGWKITFIIDEIDSLLDFDRKNNFRLIRIFRTMSQNNYCQFIFAGFEELYNLKRDIKSPLYNFCEEIMLEPLDREAALDLITKPMRSIGIHYKKEEDRELILEYTGRHPNLLQFFCKHLIDRIEKHRDVEERRTIHIEDIEELFDTKYEEYIMEEVYMFKSDISDMDKLILILLVDEESKHSCIKTFSEIEIKDKLSENSIKISPNDLHRSLKNLVMRFILLDKKKKDKYSFALSVFSEILKKRTDEDYKNQLIEEIKENESKSL